MLLVGESVGVWPADRPVNFDKFAKGPSAAAVYEKGCQIQIALIILELGTCFSCSPDAVTNSETTNIHEFFDLHLEKKYKSFLFTCYWIFLSEILI